MAGTIDRRRGLGRGATGRGRLALRKLGRGGMTLLNALLPPRCVGCGALTDRPHGLCSTCWGQMTFLAPPWCACCGRPFESGLAGLGDEPGAGMLCAACLARPPAFDSARAAVTYDDASRAIILAFKHGDRTDAAPALAGLMARLAEREVDLVVPVPLTRFRLWRRRYNQAGLLADRVARRLGLPVVHDAMSRRRGTPRQAGLNARERRANVAGAIAVRPGRRARIEGAAILLVDDVFTTGATVEACAKALKRGGARSVHVLTLARVDRPARLT